MPSRILSHHLIYCHMFCCRDCVVDVIQMLEKGMHLEEWVSCDLHVVY